MTDLTLWRAGAYVPCDICGEATSVRPTHDIHRAPGGILAHGRCLHAETADVVASRLALTAAAVATGGGDG